MRLRRTGWWALLVASHAAVFLAARPLGSSAAMRQGQAACEAGNAAAPAKTALRETAGRGGKPSSIHGGLLAELNASDLQGEAYDEALKKIFRAWIKKDLRGALLTLYGPEAGDRYSNLLRDEDLQPGLVAQSGQVLQWIRGGDFGSQHAEIAKLWAEALISAGQREVAVAGLPDLPRRSRIEVVDQLCEKAKGPELAILRSWMEPESQDTLGEYAARVLRYAGEEGPEKVFAGEEDEKVRDALAGAYKERYIDGLPPLEALAASRKLPEVYHVSLLKAIAETDLEGLSAALGEMDRRGLWAELSSEEETEFITDSIRSTCDRYSLPDDVFQELSGIKRPEARLSALRRAASEMGGSASTDAVASVVPTLPRGAELDAFIEGLAGEMSDFRSETWSRVLECVSHPELRERLGEMGQTGMQKEGE